MVLQKAKQIVKINQLLAFIDYYYSDMVNVEEENNYKLKKSRIEMIYLTGEEETIRIAELREKWEMDRVSAINHATRKGIEEGEKKNSIEIAKEMLKEKMPIEMIIKFTKLTKEEVNQIIKKN